DKWGGAVNVALQIKNIPTGAGDDFKIDATYSKGDTKAVVSTSGGSPSFAMFGNTGRLGAYQSLGFGQTADGVYLPGLITGGLTGDIKLVDPPSLHQLDVAGKTAGNKPGQVDAISRLAKAKALIRTQTARVTEHREARRTAARGDHSLGITLGVRCVALEIVARTGRDVLDLQRNVHRTAPLVVGVTGDFR